MAPSQLSQLKSALSSAGLARSSQSSKKGKSKGKAGSTVKDREKKQAKLDAIRESLNKFDVRENKTKHEILQANKKVAKGTVGAPSQSRQRAMDIRRETLLPEQQLRRTGHTGTFVDRRFGEDNPHITPEERELERFTRTREAERSRGKKGMYNLNDDEDVSLGFDDDGEEGGLLGSSRSFTLTHGGRSVNDLKGDDFDAQGLMDDDDDEELEDDFGIRRDGLETGALERDLENGYGGQQDQAEDEMDDPERKKTKAEVMAEVIAKSKSYKLARQQQKELDDDLRDELDEGLDELRELLAPPGAAVAARPAAGASSTKGDAATIEPGAEAGPSTTKRTKAEKVPQTAEDINYDQYVRELAFERRAKPKDRTKTEEEQIKEEAEQLKAQEEARLRRMRGEASPEEEEDGGRSRRSRKGGKDRDPKAPFRAPEGDDLGDDYDMDGEFTGVQEYKFGEGLKAKGDSEPESGEEDEGSEEEEEDDDDEDEEDGEADDDEEDDEEDVKDLESDASGSDDELSAPAKRPRTATTVKKEVPFTFKCPETHDDFLDIMDGLQDSDTTTVIKRIRTLYHPSLGEGNKERLQNLLGVLLDHLLYMSSAEDVQVAVINDLFPHIIALVKLNPLSAAEFFKAKLEVMHKNLVKGLSRGAANPTSRTFPGLPELLFLRAIGLIWSTSDFSHPVAAPAVLLMGQYLAQGRIRSTADIASGLFLCANMLQYESFSKRMLPEVTNFAATAMLALTPKKLEQKDIPPFLPAGDLASEDGQARLAGVRLRKSKADVALGKLDLGQMLAKDDSQAGKATLFATALELVRTSATMFAELEAFIELFEPIVAVIERAMAAALSPSLQTLAKEVADGLTRRIRFAKEARRPLQMQSHKPIPIPQYTPKFDADFSRDRRSDPDAERNEAKKIKALYKKERKGAIRELRKDNKFLAVERAKEQKAKDEAYEKRMRQVHGQIATTERAEEKAMEREKNREKRRAGR